MPRPLSVLIVDDDPALARLLGELVIVNGGHVWATAGSGEEAVDLLTAPAVPAPDLLLLDVHLPGIDGIETAARVGREHPSVRIVLISSDSLADLPSDLLADGAATFVPKSDLGPERVAALLGS